MYNTAIATAIDNFFFTYITPYFHVQLWWFFGGYTLILPEIKLLPYLFGFNFSWTQYEKTVMLCVLFVSIKISFISPEPVSFEPYRTTMTVIAPGVSGRIVHSKKHRR